MAIGDPCDVCGSPIPRGAGLRKRCSDPCRRAASVRKQRAFYAEDPDRAIAYVHAYQQRHPERHREQVSKRPKYTLEQNRAASWKTRYRLTPEDYDRIAAEQGGRCAICRRFETRWARGRPLPLSVDHDHETGEVRGLLCARCNATLGFFENRELFDAATEYLRRARSRHLMEVR